MELQDFIKNFASQFNDTEMSLFTPKTRFRDLEEWGSLTALSVMAMIAEEYEVAVKGDDIRNSQTIEDLFNVVKGKNSHV